MSQLGLDGSETLLPLRAPRALSRRQREVLAYVRSAGLVRPLSVGLMMQAGRETQRASARRHASSDGFDALRRLERRGLVTRQARGAWTATSHGETW